MRRIAKTFLPLLLAAALCLAVLTGCGDEGDIAAPAITLDSLQDHNANKTGTPVFKVTGGDLPLDGTVEAGALVEVEINDSDPALASVSGGSWSYILDVATLDEGGNTIVVSAEDSVGNKRSLTFFVTKDTTAPVVSFDQHQTPDRDGAQTIGGTVEVGSSVEVLVNSVSTAFAQVEGGLWTYNALSLAEGVHNVAVIATDEVGNPSSEITRQIEVDSTAPLLTVDYNSLAWTASTITTVEGTVGDDLTPTLTPVDTTATIENLVVDTSTDPDSWSADFVDLEPGVNLLSAVADDGSTATEAQVIVYRDLSAPAVVGNSPAHGAALDTLPVEVTVTFSEDMRAGTIEVIDVATADSPPMTLADSDGNLVDGDVVYNSATRTATYTPDPLVSGETYTATVDSSVRDELGNALGADHVWTFETK